MVAIAVSAAAMIVVFSVLNGLTGLVQDLYKAFYPDVRVTAARGKFFPADSAKLNAIRAVPGMERLTTVIEDNVFAHNVLGEQKVVTLKGIDEEYLYVNGLHEYLDTLGEDSVSSGRPYTAIAGSRILNELGADITNVFSSIELFYINPDVKDAELNPTEAFQSLELHPAGRFSVQEDLDGKYVLAPLQLVQSLFRAERQYSSIEIKTAPGEADKVRARVRSIMGNGYKVETRYEQNRTMYMVIGSEKLAVYAILLLVLLIASFNMVGALAMLVLEKQKDIAILKAMGATAGAIRQIFFLEGLLWSLAGGLAGIAVGTAVCVAQQVFGIIKLKGSFLVEEYPVTIQANDLLVVVATIFGVGLLASWYPAMRATSVAEPALKGN